MFSVILNGFKLEEPENYHSELKAHSKMFVSGLHSLGYEVERVISTVYIESDIYLLDTLSYPVMAQIITPPCNNRLYELLNIELEDGLEYKIGKDNIYKIDIAFIPTEEEIKETWSRARKLLKNSVPLLTKQEFLITRR